MKFPLSASVLPSILVGLAACTPTDEQTNGNRAGETVALSVDHRTEWRALWIEGSTDLPDGALVAYRVTHELAATAPADEWPAHNLIDAGKAAVQDGQYWTRLNTSNWPPGAVRILIQFPVPPQPDFVVERYGELGETLSGDNVTTLGGMRMIEIEETFQFRP